MSVKPRPLALLLLLALTACEWFTDFKRTPMITTWEQVGDSTRPSRTNPLLSVPTTGMMVPGYQVSYAPLPAVIDSMSGLGNVVAADARSLENGRKYYQINCAVCHGDRAMGDGPATRFGMPGINLTTDITRRHSDGYIWGIMRNGRGLMPSYNRIEEMDRWDVVNYLRALQAGTTGLAVGPVAAPGVTGRALPGATRTAPTVPVPYWGRPAAQPGGRADVAPDTGLLDTAAVRERPPAVPSPADTARTEGVAADTGGAR